MLTLLVKLLKVLNSEQSPNQIAAAISLAAIIGITPLLSLHNLLVVFAVLFLRVNLTLFLVSWPIFALLGVALSPLSESLGRAVLQAESLIPLWQTFYNTLLGRWSNFYYAGVFGSLLIGVITGLILYPVSSRLIVAYRHRWLEKLERFKIVKLLKTSRLWQMYQSYSG